MDLLRALRTLVGVADHGSFAAAARALQADPAQVTRLVADLEDHLGARLVHRTTRRITFTPIGEDVVARARAIALQVDDTLDAARDATLEARGHLRVLLPPALSAHQLAKHLPAFRARHPHVTLEVCTRGGIAVADDAFDVTLMHTRHALAGDFVARLLARTEVILCAAPSYLARHGRPAHPRDLRRLDTLMPAEPELQRGVPYERLDGTERLTIVPKRPTLTTGHIDVNLAAAEHGLGVAGLPSFVIEDALKAGRLEHVLPDWRMFHLTLWAATPTRKHLPARTRAFLDFLVDTFGGADRDPWIAPRDAG